MKPNYPIIDAYYDKQITNAKRTRNIAILIVILLWLAAINATAQTKTQPKFTTDTIHMVLVQSKGQIRHISSRIIDSLSKMIPNYQSWMISSLKGLKSIKNNDSADLILALIEKKAKKN